MFNVHGDYHTSILTSIIQIEAHLDLTKRILPG